MPLASRLPSSRGVIQGVPDMSRTLSKAAVTLAAILAFGPSVTLADGNPKGKPDLLHIVLDDMRYLQTAS